MTVSFNKKLAEQTRQLHLKELANQGWQLQKLWYLNKLFFIFLLIYLSTYQLINFSFAGNWHTFRGNNQRTGYTREQAYPPLTKAWDFQIQGDIVSSPVVYDGIVYVGARSGSIHALNAKTGELIWDYSTDGWIDASPAVSSRTVYVPSRDGYLYAFDRLNGNLLWKTNSGAPSASSPLVDNNRVYAGVGIPEKKLKVFDAETGAFLWSYNAMQPVDSSPATDETGVYFAANDGKVYGMDINSSASGWIHGSMGSYGLTSIAVSTWAVYASPPGDIGQIYMLNSLTGDEIYKYEPYSSGSGVMETASPVLSPPAGRLYYSAGNSPHTLYCLNSDNLSFVSSAPVLGNTSAFGYPSSPGMANDVLYVGTADGRIVLISSLCVQLGEIILPASVHTSPAISNGYIYFGTLGGKLYAYKAEKITSISSPKSFGLVNGTVPIRVNIKNQNLTGYKLEYGQGENPSEWNLISSGTASSEIEDAVKGNWNTQGLSNGLWSIKLTAEESAPETDNTAMVTVRVNYPPLPPTNLTVSDYPGDAGNQIQLNWTKSDSNTVTAYRIYRTSASVFSLLNEVSSNTVSFKDSTALTGVQWTYFLRAFDGYMESVDSNHALASAINDNPQGDVTPPSAVTDLSANQGLKGGGVLLNWTATGDDNNVGTASHYIIRYSTVSGFNWAANFDNATLWKNNRKVSGISGTSETETVTGLFGGVTYYFAIKTADDIPNLSVVSNVACAWAQIDTVPPLPPSELTAEDTAGDHGGSITLRWNLSGDDGAAQNDVYGYKIYRSLGSSNYISSAPLSAVTKGIKKYIDSSAETNRRFYYVVAAFDSTNNSVFSNEAYAVSADNWKFFDASWGGSVRLADGAEISIPKNSASQNDNILAYRLNPEDFIVQSSFKTLSNAKPTNIIYEIKFEKSDTKLNSPATIILPYKDSEIVGMNPENLRIYTLLGSRWQIINTSMVDLQNKKVSAQVNHFSMYAIMEYVPSGPLITSESVYTYPNPAKGDTLTFKFLVSDKSYITIDVYNVAGEKVAHFEKANCPAVTIGPSSEIVWDIRNIASGVYVYRVQAKSSSGEKSITKKLAIIH